MRTEVVRSLQELCALERQWHDLRGRALTRSVFQTPAWLLAWWPVFGSGEFFTITAYDREERLVGLAPMFILPWNGRRQVTFLGNGISDELDLLTDRECAVEAAEAILETLAHYRSRWDVCDLQDLPAGSVLHRLRIPASLSGDLRVQYTCSSVPLPDSVSRFDAQLPHGLRRNLRRYRAKLENLGAVTFETAAAGSVADHIETMIELHRARWRSKEASEGMLAGERMETFHRRAAKSLYAAGLARLHALKLDNRTIASAYILTENGRALGYLYGFDPEFEAYSPGSLILEYAIARSIEEGLREFDFLRGEEEYKKSWGAVPRHSHHLLLWHDEEQRPV